MNIRAGTWVANLLLLVLVCLPCFICRKALADGCVFHSKDGTPYKVPFGPFQPRNPLPGARHVKVVVFGDSAAWGNGDKPDHRIANLVSQYLADDTGQPVDLNSYAHSGARLQFAPAGDKAGYPVRDGQPVSDVGNSRPTTEEQAECAKVDDSNADYVLLDGCINEVGAFNIAIPPFLFNKTTPADIRKSVTSYCAAPMRIILSEISGWFPNAKIVLLNYFLVISTNSEPKPGIAPWTADETAVQMVKLKPVFKKYSNGDSLTPDGIKRQAQAWQNNAVEFLNGTTACFNWAVASANAGSTLPPITHPDDLTKPACDQFKPASNQPLAPKRIFLAMVSENPNYSYGAPQSHLWALPIPLIFGFAIGPDEMFRKRNCECNGTFYSFRNDGDCKVNPTAHPNPAGAQCYSKAILEQLGQKWNPPVPVNCD